MLFFFIKRAERKKSAHSIRQEKFKKAQDTRGNENLMIEFFTDPGRIHAGHGWGTRAFLAPPSRALSPAVRPLGVARLPSGSQALALGCCRGLIGGPTGGLEHGWPSRGFWEGSQKAEGYKGGGPPIRREKVCPQGRWSRIIRGIRPIDGFTKTLIHSGPSFRKIWPQRLHRTRRGNYPTKIGNKKSYVCARRSSRARAAPKGTKKKFGSSSTLAYLQAGLFFLWRGGNTR